MVKLATFYDHIRDIARQQEVSFTEAAQEAKGLGVELLEISQDNLLSRVEEVARELSQAGLGVSSIPSYFDFGRDQDVAKQSLPTLEAAWYLGADKLLVIPGFYREEDDPAERERQSSQMEECVNRLAELAAGYGVSLVMEDYDSFLAGFSTIRQLERFLRSCPALGCCFDTGNFRFNNEDVLEAYAMLKGRIAHVHLKDRAYAPNEGQPLTAADGVKLYPAPVGGGDLPMGEVIDLLKADGYDGAYTVEHFNAPDPWGYLKQSAEWVKARM